MLSKKLVCTLGVLAVTAMAPASAAQAAPSHAPIHAAHVEPGKADGIIAILIGVVASPAPVLVPARTEYPNVR